MEQEYSKEQLWKIYELLPKDLKEAIFSQETSENIAFACAFAKLERKKFSQVARLTGQVLLGLLPPQDFQEALMKELQIEEEKAKKISHQIKRLIFNPLKESLLLLYEKEEEKEKPSFKDIYREPVEEI